VNVLKRLVSWLFLLVAGGTLVLVLSLILILRGSLPQLEGSLTVKGIREGVSIERDAAGIPVITATNRADLAFATGFVHGQDRFFQMDLSRRRAAGELAALFGSLALPLDERNRLHRFRSRARTIAAGMTGTDRDIADAYAAGVNAGLESLNTRPFEYWLLRADVKPWLPEDSLLIAFNMFIELDDERASRDIRRGMARQALSPAMFDFLYPGGTSWDAPMTGEPVLPAPIPNSEDLGHVRTAPMPGRESRSVHERDLIPGSNNWAVAGHLTDTGRAIVANDMHLGITAPGVFYRARLIVSGADARDLSGITLPGVPLLVAGSNGHIAWGNTNSYGDWSDAVVLRPGKTPATYLSESGERTLTIIEESIEVKGEAAHSLEVRESIWGPVLEHPAEAGSLYAIHWLAHETRAVNLRGLDLELATSSEQALHIASQMGMPPQNFVVGDAKGNIGWTIAGQIPLRGDFDSQLPGDWSEGAGWTGWLPAAEYPRIQNPASGRIWTANGRVVDGESLAKIGDGGYDLAARAGQIRDGLMAREHFVPADMLAIQTDDRALFLTRWRDLLLQTLDADALRDRAGRQEYRHLAENWSARASVESAGYRLVRGFRNEVLERVFNMLMQPVYDKFGADSELRISRQFEAPLWTMVNQQPAHLLSEEYPNWQALLLSAVDENLDYFSENFSGPLSQRTWGERNTASIAHPLSRALPFLGRWLDMPADRLPGDSNLPRAQGPTFGASERFGVAPGDEANGYLHIPSGQSGHPLSDFYRAGHAAWVNARPTPFLPGEVMYSLHLAPAATE
jgi:penicillin amidase